MNFNFKHCVLAFGFLTLEKTNALCDVDHASITQNTELTVHTTCSPFWDIYPKPMWMFDFGTTGPFAGVNVPGWFVRDDFFVCDTDYSVEVYSSYDPLPAVTHAGVIDKAHLDQVNWLINHYPTFSTISIPGCYNGTLYNEDYHAAVWCLINDEPLEVYTTYIDSGAVINQCVVDHLFSEAESNGDDYEVDCSDSDPLVGVILVDTYSPQVVLALINPNDITGACQCPPDELTNGNVGGDPHFKTWSGERYDFHGICDLILLKNLDFENGLGMVINVRAKKIQQFSYISTAAIRIGNDMFEVAGKKDGDTYWLNGKKGAKGGALEDMAMIAGYPITFRQVSSHSHEYTIDISGEGESIALTTWKEFVRVDVKGASSASFHGSLGLLGSFDKKGAKLGRDGVTVFDNIDEFGLEWQVLASEDTLFHSIEGPHYPVSRCEIPSQTVLRRRLVESIIAPEEAELACAHAAVEERDLCIYDVMATNDEDVAGAY